MELHIPEKQHLMLSKHTQLIIDCLLNYYGDSMEAQSLINTLASGNFQISKNECHLIWTASYNYYPLLNGSDRTTMQQIAICFDPYAQELQSKLNMLKEKK